MPHFIFPRYLLDLSKLIYNTNVVQGYIACQKFTAAEFVWLYIMHVMAHALRLWSQGFWLLSNNMFYRVIQRPGFDGLGNRVTSVVHLDTMGIAGENFIPKTVQFHNSLDAFQAYHVTNKYNDY